MTDEKFVFVSDVREKKSIGRSARNKRTHAGKGGSVKFPSDYLSKKELKAMNGECRAYRLNEPMAWADFKALPDDLKTSYVKLLREKFDVPDSEIANMFGVHRVTLCKFLKTLGLSVGSKAGGSHKGWDGTAWFAWVNGNKIRETPAEEATVAESATVEDAVSLEVISDPVPVPLPEIKVLPVRKNTAIPQSGSMTFCGSAETALNTVAVLLGGGKCPHQYNVERLPRRRGA